MDHGTPDAGVAAAVDRGGVFESTSRRRGPASSAGAGGDGDLVQLRASRRNTLHKICGHQPLVGNVGRFDEAATAAGGWSFGTIDGSS
jgi:hypothetical protein